MKILKAIYYFLFKKHDIATIHLKNIRGNFNSVQFDFYEGNNPVDIYASPKCNPYIRSRRKFKEDNT